METFRRYLSEHGNMRETPGRTKYNSTQNRPTCCGNSRRSGMRFVRLRTNDPKPGVDIFPVRLVVTLNGWGCHFPLDRTGKDPGIHIEMAKQPTPQPTPGGAL